MSAKRVFASSSCVSNDFVNDVGLPLGSKHMMHVLLCPPDSACRSRHSPSRSNDVRPGVHQGKGRWKRMFSRQPKEKTVPEVNMLPFNCPGPHSPGGPQRRLCQLRSLSEPLWIEECFPSAPQEKAGGRRCSRASPRRRKSRKSMCCRHLSWSPQSRRRAPAQERGPLTRRNPLQQYPFPL